MGKTKRMLDDFHLSQEEITDELYARGDEDYQYQKWLNSPEYVEHVNEQIALAKPKFSQTDVDTAISEAFKSLVVTSEEVGIDVYEKLFRQHFFENLEL
tara:strand:- start:417 stop:713 length:297 start_codon:yes stop_codon:yes gene_type:complete